MNPPCSLRSEVWVRRKGGRRDAIFSLPSPLQTTLLIKASGANYHADMLNSPDAASGYSISMEKALNLGIYGADLGYVTCYEQTQDALSEAVELLEAVFVEGWDENSGLVRAALVDALIERAVYYSTKYFDEPTATRDAARAYGLSPPSLKVVAVYSQTSLLHAEQLYKYGDVESARLLFREAEMALKDAQTQYPSTTLLMPVLRRAEEARSVLMN